VDDISSKETSETPNLQYGIEDVPPWYLCILLGFQVSTDHEVIDEPCHNNTELRFRGTHHMKGYLVLHVVIYVKPGYE